jgi:hypothetical protein
MHFNNVFAAMAESKVESVCGHPGRGVRPQLRDHCEVLHGKEVALDRLTPQSPAPVEPQRAETIDFDALRERKLASVARSVF